MEEDDDDETVDDDVVELRGFLAAMPNPPCLLRPGSSDFLFVLLVLIQ